FDLSRWEHHARYDRQHQRMEIGLRSLGRQHVTIGDSRYTFLPGEMIHTEYSHKYTVEGFSELADCAGWRLERYWVDPQHYFGVLYLTCVSSMGSDTFQ